MPCRSRRARSITRVTGALVLAGGGVAGIAWELGVLRGIQDVAPDTIARVLGPSTTFVGTSAGSSVAAQLASGLPLETLFETQLAEKSGELDPDIDIAVVIQAFTEAVTGATSEEDRRKRMGAVARAAKTVPQSVRREVIASRLPSHEWSERRVIITAVDADSGELRAFDRNSGVDLVDAVSASCAVPGVWPTVEIEGRRYMDGGSRSIANADLAAGSDPVLILVPGPEESPLGPAIPQSEFDALAPAAILTILTDEASLAAFGMNPLDPATRRPSALAGREVGRRMAGAVTDFWRI